MEIWKDIEDYQGLYQISNLGRVKSLERTADNGYCVRTVKERILKPLKDKGGYLFVNLSKDGKVKNVFVHRLVVSAFISNPDDLPQVNHKDEDKTNNTVDNLEYCNAKYNNNYGTKNKRCSEKQINHIKRSKKVLCVETGIIYPSAMEVKRQMGFNQGNISNCCNGKCKQVYGYHWKYVE